MKYSTVLKLSALMICASFMSAGAVPAIRSEAPSKMSAEFQARYNRMNAAMANLNTKAYLAFHAVDYHGSDIESPKKTIIGRKEDRVHVQREMETIRYWRKHDHMVYREADVVQDVSVGPLGITVHTEKHSNIQPEFRRPITDLWAKRGADWVIKEHHEGEGHPVQPTQDTSRR